MRSDWKRKKQMIIMSDEQRDRDAQTSVIVHSLCCCDAENAADAAAAVADGTSAIPASAMLVFIRGRRVQKGCSRPNGKILTGDDETPFAAGGWIAFTDRPRAGPHAGCR